MTWFDWLVTAAIVFAAYFALFAAVALLERRERQRKERVLTQMQVTERSIRRMFDEARCVSCAERLGKPDSLTDEARK